MIFDRRRRNSLDRKIKFALMIGQKSEKKERSNLTCLTLYIENSCNYNFFFIFWYPLDRNITTQYLIFIAYKLGKLIRKIKREEINFCKTGIFSCSSDHHLNKIYEHH